MGTKTYGDANVDYGDGNYSYIGGLMADRWWVNDDADNAWENANNWSTAEGGAGGAGIPTSAEDVKFSDTSSSAACNMSAASVYKSIAFAAADTGGSDDYSGLLTDNANTVGASGNILVANIANILAATGVWSQIETGNLGNPQITNILASLITAQPSKTNTLIASFYTSKLTVGSGVLNSSSGIFAIYAVGNDFLIIDSSATVSTEILVNDNGGDRTLAGISCAGWSGAFYTNFSGQKLTLTGAFLKGDGWTHYTGELDFNDNDVTLATDLRIGQSSNTVIVRFGTGTTAFRDLILGAGSTGTINLYGESSGINCSRNFTLTGFIWNKSLETINMIASSGTPTITYAGNAIKNLSINNAGVTSLTAQDAGIMDSFLVLAGNYTDGGFAHSVYGTIGIVAVADALTSTGVWTAKASGNLLNAHYSNALSQFNTDDGITLTLAANFWANKYIIGNTTINNTASEYPIVYVIANDWWAQHASASINTNVLFDVGFVGNFTNAAAVDLGTNTLTVDTASAANRSATINGNITCGDLKILSHFASFYFELICGGNLAVDNILLGDDAANEQGYIDFGAGTHVVATDIKINNVAVTNCQIDWSSCDISIGNSLDMTGIVSTKGTATVTFNASSGTPTITYASQALADVVINNNGVTSFISQDAGEMDSFTLTAGKYSDGGSVQNIYGTISIANVASAVTSAAIWTMKATGNLLNQHYSNVLAQLNIDDGVTATLLGEFWGRIFNIGNSTITNGASDKIVVFIDSNDFWTQHASATINVDILIAIGAAGGYSNTGAINLGSNTIEVETASATDRIATLNGDITCGDFRVFSIYAGFYISIILGGNLAVNNILLGDELADEKGYLDLGAGTHVVSSDIKVNKVAVTNCQLDWGSGGTSVGGDINLPGITSTPGTATIELTGNNSELNGNDESVYFIDVNKTAGQSVELKGDIRASKITMTGGSLIRDSLLVSHVIRMI